MPADARPTTTSLQIVRVDQGGVNERILAREAKVDYRRIEAASLKMPACFTSAEGKRLFVRMFATLQLNAHFISVIARTRLEGEDVARVESALRERIDAVSAALDKAIDGAEALFKVHGITRVATYDTQALHVEVGVLSSSGRRYLEVLGKLDQLMPMLQTLEIHEVITTREVDKQRALVKRQVRGVATTARNFASGLRRRMNEAASGGADAAEVDRDETAQAPAMPPADSDAMDSPVENEVLAEASAVVDDGLVVEAASPTKLG
ncbi:MAG TPA: DUF1845 domain-containing protein [Rubrivivax sp.]|nr:DUF1845 domain-containing protein [Rubrivivax sp.]